MKFKTHSTMIIVIIFMMISSITALSWFEACCGKWKRDPPSQHSERSIPQPSAPPRRTPPTSLPPSLSSGQFQPVQTRSESPYKEICVDTKAAIPETRETDDTEEDGKQVSKAIDGNIAVCAKQTQFMNYMEDRYDMRKIVTPNGNIISLFALYDGHGNANVAECAANNLLYTIEKEILNQRGQPDYKEILVSEIKNFDKKLKDVYDWESLPPTETSFSEAIERMKKNIQTKENEKKDIKYIVGGGSTALIGLIDDDTEMLYVANLGDTHGEMCCDSEGNRIQLSHDFDIINITENEKKRIEKAGGKIITKNNNGYEDKKLTFNGIELSVARALADYEFKKNYEDPVVSYEPEVQDFPLTEYSKYILFATDGAWPRLNQKEVNVQEAFYQISKYYTDPKAYYGSLNLCNYMEANMNVGNADNVTVMVVNLTKNKN